MAYRSNRGSGKRTSRSAGSNRKSGVSKRSGQQTVKLVIEHVQAGQGQLPPGVMQIAQKTTKAKL